MLVGFDKSFSDFMENCSRKPALHVVEKAASEWSVSSLFSNLCLVEVLFNTGNPKQMTVLDNTVCAVGKHAKEHLLNKQFLLFLKASRRAFFPFFSWKGVRFVILWHGNIAVLS